MLFVHSLSAPVSLAGQSSQCGTQMGPEPNCSGGEIGCDMSVTGPLVGGQCDPENEGLFVIRTYVHRVQDDNGQHGQPLVEINEGMNIMIEQFAPHGILFSFEELDELDESIFMDFDMDKHSHLLASLKNNQDGMDIFALPAGVWGNARGFFPYAEYTACIMGGYSNELKTLLSHEVGHNFGLFHTFETICGECQPTQPLECACSDFVMDTAFDPVLSQFCVNEDCEYHPSYCPSGVTFPGYDPPIENIMSYSPRQCRQEFTEGQKRRMKRYLTTCEKLQGTLVNGPVKIANGFDITIAAPISQCLPGFIVESGARLTIATDLRFQEGARIVVETGGKLTVDGATLSGCDDDYWQGIEVYGNPATDQLPFSSQGYVLLNNGAAVEKAVYPVRAYDGGIVRAFSTDFLECGELAFFDYSFQNYSTFQGCSFTRTADFGLPFYLTQLYLQKVNGVTVNNCHFETIQPTGVEFNGNGIVGADARFAVLNGTIIDGYYNGITGYSWGTEPWTSFRVEACTLQNNFVGVASWDVDNVVVRDNLFQKIGAHPSSGVKRGLDLWNCSAFVVRDNQFVGYSSGGTRIGPSIGVLAANTGSENNEIKKNIYQDLIVANQAEFENRGEDAEEGLQYLCNNNTSTAYDFYIWDQGIAQIQGGGDATKNAFSHPNTNATNSTYEDFNNQSANPIDYYHLNVPIETPENGYYFNINPIITTETVNCTDGVIDEDGKLTSSEEQILVQDFITVRTTYQNQKSTYSALPPDSPYAPDLERQMTRSRDTMHRIANRIIRSELADTTGLDVTKIRTWLRNKDSRESAYRVVETYLWEGDTIAARQVRDSIPLKYELKDAQASNHNSYVQWTELKIELSNNGKDILNLDSSTVLYYQSIADTTIGRAGTQLQGLLNLGYQYNYRLNPKIPGGGSQGILAPPTNGTKNKEQAIFEELIAVPNPAKEFVTFRYALPESAGPAMLYIADINGKTIAQMKLQDRAGSIQWSVSHLQSGIYFYSIRYAGSTFSPRKLALIR